MKQGRREVSMPGEVGVSPLVPSPGNSINGLNAQKKQILLNTACKQRCDAAVLIGMGRSNRVSPTPEFSCSTLPFRFCLTNARVIKEDSAPDDRVKQPLGLRRCWWCWVEDMRGRRLAGRTSVPWKVAAPVNPAGERQRGAKRNQSPRPCAKEHEVQSAIRRSCAGCGSPC